MAALTLKGMDRMLSNGSIVRVVPKGYRGTNVNSRKWLPLLLLITPCVLCAEEARVFPPDVPAAGRQVAVVTIPRFGRWALTATSREGVALTVVDRMAGPGERVGKPGEEDGRADVFLDRGQVRLVLNGDSRAKGRARLAVREFVEAGGATPLRLVEMKPVETTLDDFEKRSFWVSIDGRRRVAFEAAGRNLADLRLWKGGTWLVAAEPESEVTTPRPGRPLRVMRLWADLEPGLYLLSAYGSPGEPWAEESPEHPLCLTWGFPQLGVAGRARHAVGASGIDRFLIAGAATFAGLELPEARPISFNAAPWDDAQPFREAPEGASIGKRTNPPAVTLAFAGRPDGLTLVTVRGDAGQAYVLTHFERRDEYPVRGGGDWWIGSIPSADVRDAVDETGVLVERGQRAPVRSAEITVAPGRPWAGRGNLDGPLSLFFRTAAAGKYDLEAAGVDARMQILPALAPRSSEIKPIALRGKGTVDLDAGLWDLSVHPVKKGIVTLSIRAAGEAAPAPQAPRGGILFPKVTLSENTWYTLVVGKRPGVVSGLVFRKLPLDLTDPLAVAARPAETVSVPFVAAEESVLAAETEDGAALAVSVDGAPPVPNPLVSPGAHEASVTLGGDAPRVFSIAAHARSLSKDAPLPPLPDGALATMPEFPKLLPAAPRTLDLAAGEAATFDVNVPEPGLYRIETTGLLATGALLRTRTVTQFRKEEENGVGRNALVADYLREGDYQVSVQPRGLSAGHLGVALSKTAVVDGGTVTDGVPARLSLGAGEAAAFRLDVRRAGTYRLRALGLNRKFPVRLEDKDGWPLLKPGVEGDLRRTLAKGTYRLVVLPFAVGARAVVSLERESGPLRFRGHGPHALPLARRADALWLEPAEGAERVPDRFAFTLPAPADVNVGLTAGMEGRLLRDGAAATAVPAGAGFHGPLGAGAYVLETTAARRDSRIEYAVSVTPEPLVAGLARAVTAPAEIPVSIGGTGLYEFASSGSEDVRARLLDASGTVVAQNDDRDDDWNFAIARPLAPGRYTLRVEPAGKATAGTTVALRELPLRALPAEPLPIARELQPGRGVLSIPVAVEAGSLLSVSAAASESVGLSITAEDGTPLAEGTGRLARVDLPVGAARTLRIGLFSADGRGGSVNLAASAAVLAEWSERRLEKGGPLPNGAVAVTLERPGVFRLEASGPAPRVSAAPDVAATPAEGPVAAGGRRIVIVSEGSVRGTRLRLDEKDVTLGGPAALVDLAAAKGPVLVRARAATGQPGLLLAGGAATADERTALAAALEAPPAVSVAAGPGESLSDVVLSQLAFPSPRPENPERLSFDGAVASRGARAFALPPGAKRLRVALGAGLAALVSKGRDGLALVGIPDAASDETLDTDGDRITFLSTSGSEARFALDVFAASAETAPLVPRAPFAASLPASGTLRIRVAAPATGETRTLHVRGASGPATLLARDGRNLRGLDLGVPPAGGTLLLPHAPGLVLAWVDRAGSEADDLFGDAAATAPAALVPPATITLSGDVAAFAVAAGAPSLLSFRSAGPALSLVAKDGSPPEVSLHPGGVSLDLYAASGSVRLLLRSLGTGGLGGTAALTTTPVTRIAEGLGPEALLGAGQSRLYGFHVARSGAVGIGVRASSDLVTATLFSGGGKELGEGLVQMPELAVGDYLVSVRAPADASPVKIRPALAGVEPPGTGPPPEVVLTYVRPGPPAKGTSAASRASEDEAAGTPQGDAEPDETPDATPEEGDPR